MGFTETLRLIMTADHAAAVRSVENYDAAIKKAGKTTDASQKSLDKWGRNLTHVGAGLVGFGAVALTGLVHMAKASEEANLSTVKLRNTIDRMPKLAGENAKQFTDLATKIQSVTAADADAIIEGEAMLGTFNLTARQIKGITPLVVDYARKFGVEIPKAAIQVGKALDGNIGALKKSGVTIDATAFKADHYTAVQKALADQVGGFAKAEGATFAGSLERMKNQLGDLEEGVGRGAVDAFTQLFGVVGKTAAAMESVSPGTQAAIGKFATFGAVALTAVGGLSVLIGQVMLARERFGAMATGIANIPGRLMGLVVPATAVEGAFNGATASVSRFSAALATVSEVTAFIAAFIALREVVKGLDKDTSDSPENLRKIEAELERLADTGSKVGPKLKDAFDTIKKGPQGLAGGQKMVDQIDAIDKALARLAAKDPKAAAAAFKEIVDRLHDMSGASRKAIATGEGFDEYRAAVDQIKESQGAATDAVDGTGKALDGEAEAAKAADDALKEYEDQLHGLLDPLFGMEDAIRDNAKAQGDFNAKALESAAAEQAYLTAVKEHGPKSKEAAAASLAMMEAQNELSDAHTKAIRSAADYDFAMHELRNEVQKNPAALDQAKAKLREWQRQGLITAAQAKKAAREFDGLAGSIGKTPNRKMVVVSIRGADQAHVAVVKLRDAMGQLHDKFLTIGLTAAIGPQASQLMKSKLLAGQFALGGKVPGPPGSEQIIQAHGGEIVVPAHNKAAMAKFLPQALGTAAALSRGGGVNVENHFHFEGAIISSRADAERWVASAWNRAAANRMVNVRGRPL